MTIIADLLSEVSAKLCQSRFSLPAAQLLALFPLLIHLIQILRKGSAQSAISQNCSQRQWVLFKKKKKL